MLLDGGISLLRGAMRTNLYRESREVEEMLSHRKCGGQLTLPILPLPTYLPTLRGSSGSSTARYRIFLLRLTSSQPFALSALTSSSSRSRKSRRPIFETGSRGSFPFPREATIAPAAMSEWRLVDWASLEELLQEPCIGETLLTNRSAPIALQVRIFYCVGPLREGVLSSQPSIRPPVSETHQTPDPAPAAKRQTIGLRRCSASSCKRPTLSFFLRKSSENSVST